MEHPIVYAEINEPLLSQLGAAIEDLDRLLRGAGYRLFDNSGAQRRARQLRRDGTERTGQGRPIFDVLAVHQTDDRLEDLVKSAVPS